MFADSISIKIQPSVLRWARESIGLSQTDVADKFKKPISFVAAWEKGDAMPSLAQLEKLTQIYKRPLAVFFLPSPPYEKPLNQDFRTLPDSDLNAITPDIRLAVRKAKRLQAILYEINDSKNPVSHPLHKTFKVKLGGSIQQYGLELRKHLNIPLEKQTSWKDEGEALNEYKDCFERNGLYIFQQSLPLNKKEQFSAKGFSLTDSEFPVIVLNSADAVNSRIFTIFHELCHILFNTGGIFNDINIDSLSGDAKRIEIFCNAFAGAFLVPEHDLINEGAIKNVRTPQKWDDATLIKLSKKYKVSGEVILRRLLDLNLTTNSFYQDKRAEWEDNFKKYQKAKKSNKVIVLPSTKCISEKGRGFVSSVLSNHKTGKITYRDVMNYLGVSMSWVPKVELLINRYETRHV